jgi:hypothetical protein
MEGMGFFQPFSIKHLSLITTMVGPSSTGLELNAPLSPTKDQATVDPSRKLSRVFKLPVSRACNVRLWCQIWMLILFANDFFDEAFNHCFLAPVFIQGPFMLSSRSIAPSCKYVVV